MSGLKKTRPQGRVFASDRSAGFTLVELVVILIVMSVIAVVGMPRFFGVNQFEQMGYADALASAIRFAQKTAVATGCDTRVQVSASSFALWQRADSCDSGAFTRALSRGGGTQWQGSAPAGVTSSTLDIYFDAVGVPYRHADDNALSESVDISVGERTLTVEAQTGFVH
jgi:MSHA pilin protein MshC